MKAIRWLVVVACLAGCDVGGNTSGTGGTGGGMGGAGGAGPDGSAGTGGGAGTGGMGGSGGAGGSGGTGGSDNLPAYDTINAKGKIAGKTFGFVTGFARQSTADANAMDVELLAFSPEIMESMPCWNKPPAGSDRNLELRVQFRVPKTGGSFVWVGNRNISGATGVTLVSLNTDGSSRTSMTDQAKVMIGALPAEARAELNGSLVVQADTNNSINGTFIVRRCLP